MGAGAVTEAGTQGPRRALRQPNCAPAAGASALRFSQAYWARGAAGAAGIAFGLEPSWEELLPAAHFQDLVCAEVRVLQAHCEGPRLPPTSGHLRADLLAELRELCATEARC